VNNKRVELVAKDIFGEEAFLKEKNGTWYIGKRIRPDAGKAMGCSCCRGNRAIGVGGSPKEALEDARTHNAKEKKIRSFGDYFLGIIVDNESIDISQIDHLMEPYSYNLEVPEYEITCDCVGEVATCHADIVSRKYKKRAEVWKSEYRIHWLKDEPVKSCGGCGGTGKAKSTENPNIMWRNFTVGGRWDGAIRGYNPPTDQGRGRIENNIVSVKKYINMIDQTRYRSIVLYGQIDYLLIPGDFIKTKRFSKKKLVELLSFYEDKWIVGIDCSI
jgi:hypothetical protein